MTKTVSCARCYVNGLAFNRLERKLKPALPKSRDKAAPLVIAGSPTAITLSLPGCAIELPAIVDAPFRADLPWQLFKNLLDERVDEESLVYFEFGEGYYKFGGVTSRSSQITFQLVPAAATERQTLFDDASVKTKATGTNPAPPPDQLDAPLGFPLLGAYVYVRKYGQQKLLVNKAFVQHQLDLEQLLKKIDKIVRPLGITRCDIEKLLDQRLSLSPKTTAEVP